MDTELGPLPNVSELSFLSSIDQATFLNYFIILHELIEKKLWNDAEEMILKIQSVYDMVPMFHLPQWHTTSAHKLHQQRLIASSPNRLSRIALNDGSDEPYSELLRYRAEVFQLHRLRSCSA
jgi:hypothetical protein